MSKGSRPRPCNKKRFDENYARVFGEKRLNVWRDAPLRLKGDSDGIQGDTGDRMRDWSNGGRVAGVPQVPGGALDPQAAKPVEPPPCRNCGSTKYTPGGGYCDSCGGTF